MLIDIGGGTVDIVSHAIVEGNVEEIIPPQGNDSGGTTVNDGFRKLLGQTLRDPTFHRYIGPQVEKSAKTQNSRDLDCIVNKEFEDIKRDFGTHCTDTTGPKAFSFQLPRSLWSTYESNMDDTGKDILFDEDTYEITISHRKMVELFEPTIQGIMSIVKEVLQKVGDVIENVYLAGGFGGCKYVTVRLQKEFKKMRYECRLHYAPGEAELGIVEGAVMFRCNPSIVHKRKADATYGINVGIPFQSGLHDEAKRYFNKDKDEHYCNQIFCTIVEKGESISSSKVYVTDITMGYKDTKEVSFNVYTSSERDVWYTTDPGVQYLGHFELKVSGFGLGRDIEVAVDFTHCEIQLRAYDKQNFANEVKIALDFLCNT